jgi:hypothetical protein
MDYVGVLQLAYSLKGKDDLPIGVQIILPGIKKLNYWISQI